MKVKLEIHIPPKWQAVLEVLRFHHAVVLSIFSALIPTLDFPGFAPAKVPSIADGPGAMDDLSGDRYSFPHLEKNKISTLT